MNYRMLFTAAAALSVLAAPTASIVAGDANADGRFDAADAAALQGWLLQDGTALTSWEAAELCEDGVIDVFDLGMMKRQLMAADAPARVVRVTNTQELKDALASASAGDEIVLAGGEYLYSGATPKGFMFQGTAEGTADAPIILRSEDPSDPAILCGTTTQSNTVLAITGDWWEVRDVHVTNGQKGIVIDNSEHTRLIRCEVYGTGSEGIHFRDNSSYCLAENCYVHDTGLVSPGFGEAIYVGSAKSTTGYGFDCHYNTIRGCRLGPNVAAEHIDVKEYTIGTRIEYCIFDGTGMSGENSSKSFVNIKGNDCILRHNVGYRNGCDKILRAFEQNQVADGWGQNAFVYGNKVYMDTSVGATGKKMYFHNAWNCSVTVWNNFMAYESGELFSVDNETDQWDYYNSNLLTYGDSSHEEMVAQIEQNME